MAGSVHEVFSDLILPWAESGVFPEASVTAMSPEFAALYSSTPRDLDLDAWVHPEPREGWVLRRLEFPDHFDGFFSLYLPDPWDRIVRKGNAAAVSDEGRQRQSLFLTRKPAWAAGVRGFLDRNPVTAFSCDAPFPPGYHRWIFATGRGEPDYWAWGVYSSGDFILLIKGDGRTAAELEVQLTSLLNSNPWSGWIEAARRQTGRR